MHATPRHARAFRITPFLLPALGLPLGGIGPAAGDVAAQDPLTGFDAYVAEAVKAWDVPGLSVAVVKDGAVVFEKGYGVLTLGRPGGVDAHTLFAIGSTTKAMTAASIGMLVDEGKLAWDDPVIDHLPWFRLHDPWLTREVTVRDLLTHRAGLGNVDFLWYEQDADTREVLEKLRLVEPAYSLRGGFVYQNLMYAAAGAVVEAVSGIPWARFVETRIFAPLGMSRSVTTLAAAERMENVASPHEEVDGELAVIANASVDPVAAAGSVWSSAHDMARWLAFLLRGCETEAGEALLEPRTCGELFQPQAIVRTSPYPTARLTNPHWITYGLGWFQQDYEGRKLDFHTGSIDGMVAIAGLVRDEGVGVYVLANRDHAELRHALMLRVVDLYDADPPRDWSAELHSLYGEMAARADSQRAAAAARRVEGTRPTLPPERYAGTYIHPLRGTLRVEATGEGGLRVTYGRLTGPLEHWNYDTFRARWDAAWRGTQLVTFRLDARGAVEALEASGAEFRRVEQEG